MKPSLFVNINIFVVFSGGNCLICMTLEMKMLETSRLTHFLQEAFSRVLERPPVFCKCFLFASSSITILKFHPKGSSWQIQFTGSSIPKWPTDPNPVSSTAGSTQTNFKTHVSILFVSSWMIFAAACFVPISKIHFS